ncbi:MAG TPA: periplasmic heavy metal sensor, partial [Polyangia bacterium]
GQERALADAMEKFHAEVAPLHAEVDKTRADLAAALRKSSFDEVVMGELFARHDEAIEKVRRAMVGLGARVHEALDERQRDHLATLIERGHGFSGFGRRW